MLKVEYIVNSIFDSITWLLSETESNQVWLVDCGDVEPIRKRLKGKEIAGVLLTHAHFDHIYGLLKLIGYYPNCRIYTNESGRGTLADAKQNMSLYHEMPLSVNVPQVTICGDGDEIDLFRNITAKVYETPGHHPSCITFMVGEYLFTGDSFIPGCNVVTNLPNGNKKQSMDSLNKIMEIAISKTVCAGHFKKD